MEAIWPFDLIETGGIVTASLCVIFLFVSASVLTQAKPGESVV